MASEIDILRQIDQYINHRMTVSERKAFEEKVAQDPDLARMLAGNRTMHMMASFHEGDSLSEKLSAMGPQLLAEHEQSLTAQARVSTLRSWAVAASIIVFASVLLYIFLQKSSTLSYQEMAVQLFQEKPVGQTSMGQSSVVRLQKLFEREAFEDFIVQTEAAAQEDSSLLPQNPILYLYLGAAHFQKETPDLSAAAEAFSSVPTTSLYLDEGRWRLALTYLRDGKTEEAVSILCSLLNRSFRTEADDALTRLDQSCP
ncbi:MAG: hypothetical protein AAF206_18210 [Bacteroidota bacterium]